MQWRFSAYPKQAVKYIVVTVPRPLCIALTILLTTQGPNMSSWPARAASVGAPRLSVGGFTSTEVHGETLHNEPTPWIPKLR